MYRYVLRLYSGNRYAACTDATQQLGLADAIAAYQDRKIGELEWSHLGN